MTSYPTGDQRATGRLRVTWLIGLTLLVVVALGGAWFLVSWVFGRQSADLRSDSSTEGAQFVRIVSNNADLTISPSADGQVHVHTTGSYTGDQPQVTATLDGENVIVNVLCSDQWLRYCDLEATVQLPPTLAALVVTDNGDIDVDGITGDINVTTDNGDVTVTDGGREDGAISLITDNGDLEVRGAAGSVVGTSDNGDIEVSLSTVPTRVELRSDNGDIDLRVPGSAKYAVTTESDSGNSDTSVLVDSTSVNTIIAVTDNGDVTVRPGG